MKISNFLAFPILTSGSLALFVVIFFIFFYQFSEQYTQEKSDLIAKAVIQNIQSEIQTRIATVNNFGVDEFVRTQGRETEFVEFCERFMYLFPDIFAVNFVDSKGIIQRVYPVEQNKAAYQQNLNLRPEIKPYLDLSKKDRISVLSHRIKTYQGIHGYTLYIPIFSAANLHVGWLNIVFNLDDWLRQYLKVNEWQNALVEIGWIGTSDFTFREGPETAHLTYEKQFSLLNQKLNFKIGFVPSYLDEKRDVYRVIVLLFGSLLVLFLFFLTYQRGKNEYQLQTTNSNLETSHILISSLTHDIANPLFSVGLILKKIFESPGSVEEKDKKRLNQLFKSINDMLEAGKNLQSLRLGKTSLKLTPVNLKSSLQVACLVLQDFIDNKQIRIDMDQVPSDLMVLVEQQSFVHNVLINVLTNSVKFSPVGDVIRVFVEVVGSKYHVIIEDNGFGIDESQVKNKTLESRDGTLGEKGYGFGLMQVIYFMKFYNGRFEIENKPVGTGARVTLQFPKI